MSCRVAFTSEAIPLESPRSCSPSFGNNPTEWTDAQPAVDPAVAPPSAPPHMVSQRPLAIVRPQGLAGNDDDDATSIWSARSVFGARGVSCLQEPTLTNACHVGGGQGVGKVVKTRSATRLGVQTGRGHSKELSFEIPRSARSRLSTSNVSLPIPDDFAVPDRLP